MSPARYTSYNPVFSHTLSACGLGMDGLGMDGLGMDGLGFAGLGFAGLGFAGLSALLLLPVRPAN